MYGLAMRLVQIVADGLVIVTSDRVLRRRNELVRHPAHRRGDHDDLMTFSRALYRKVCGLRDAFSGSDRRAAEFHYD